MSSCSNGVANEANIGHASSTCNDVLSNLPDELILKVIQCLLNKADFLSLSLVSRRIGGLTQGVFYRHINIVEPHAVLEIEGNIQCNPKKSVLLLSTLNKNPNLARYAQTLYSGHDYTRNHLYYTDAHFVVSLAIDEGIEPTDLMSLEPHHPGKLQDNSFQRERAIQQAVSSLDRNFGLYRTLVDVLILQLPNLRHLTVDLTIPGAGIFARALQSCLEGLKDRLPKLRKLTVMYSQFFTSSSDGLPSGLGDMLQHIPTIVGLSILDFRGHSNVISVIDFDILQSHWSYTGRSPIGMAQNFTVTKLCLRGCILTNTSFRTLTERFPAVTDFTFDITSTFSNDDDDTNRRPGQLPIRDISRALSGWDAQLQCLELKFRKDDRYTMTQRSMLDHVKLDLCEDRSFANVKQLIITIDHMTLYRDQQCLDQELDSFPPLPQLTFEKEYGIVQEKPENIWLGYNLVL